MLAFLLVSLLTAAGCVIWFMREAMQNERLAIRQRLADAYLGHLHLAAERIDSECARRLAALDAAALGPETFARSVREAWVESLVCFDASGKVLYPSEAPIASQTEPAAGPRATEAKDAAAGAAEILTKARSLALAGQQDAAIRLIAEEFADPKSDRAVDGNGRLVAANAELMALGWARGPADPRVAGISGRLRQRVLNYTSENPMPAAQRRFLMRPLRDLARGSGGDAELDQFFAAEDLAARFLEAEPHPAATSALRSSFAPDLWKISSPRGQAMALFTTAGLRTRLQAALASQALPSGIHVTIASPGEDPVSETALASLGAGALLPGWRLTLHLDDRSLFDKLANRKVAAYLWTALLVIVFLAGLAAAVAQTFRRQIRLTRLKNDLVATVSHELKTPLTSMRALVDTLLDREHFDETTTREYLVLLARENARLSRLIENFLTFSKLERNKHNFELEPVAPERLVDVAVSAFAERIRTPDFHLEIQTAAGLPEILADADALVTALLNLLENAWKYSPDEKHIALRTESTGHAVRFTVSDRGIGLDPAQLRQVFDRFYQADRSLSRIAGGCGLGLSIAHDIVAAHRGFIDVASRLGQGSAFTMEIPVATSVAAKRGADK